MPRAFTAIFGLILLTNSIRHLVQHDLLWGTIYALAGLAVVADFIFRRRKRPSA